MRNEVDNYIENVIKVGDEGSKLLAAVCAPTLKNNEFVRILKQGMNGIATLKVPNDYYVAVHSASGHDEKGREIGISHYTHNMVKTLVEQSKLIGATPIAFANVIDSATGDIKLLTTIANVLVTEANMHHLAILNGENAILGNRVTKEANVSGTMISFVPKKSIETIGVLKRKDINFIIFNPYEKPVYMNSDGIGTKTEFYERKGNHFELALADSLAMKVDDSIKLGAVVKAVSDVVEIGSHAMKSELIKKHILTVFKKQAEELGRLMHAAYILQFEDATGRIGGYEGNNFVFNISGSAVSTIDEERLANPLKPKAGDYIVAIRGKPTPRSNGITAKRETMVKVFGNEWHKTDIGKIFMEYLAEPSTIFYPVFRELVDNNLASSVYHMSGGAYNGKLARPIAQHGLFAHMENLFEPDWREVTLAAYSLSAKEAYAKFPMGNEGFITTDYPSKAIQVINKFGLEARVVAELKKTDRTGVEFKAFNGQDIYFSGKD